MDFVELKTVGRAYKNIRYAAPITTKGTPKPRRYLCKSFIC